MPASFCLRLHGQFQLYLIKVNNMEITLFDSQGIPVAYIADDAEHTIYLWEGKAVCYLLSDKIYTWKGHHIGWFFQNIIYDINGMRVGYTRQTCPCITQLEKLKAIKQIKSIKSIRQISFIRPIFSKITSKVSLYEFLSQDS